MTVIASQHLVLVGGGLQNALIALAMADHEHVDVTLLEQRRDFAVDHTWCFFDTDLDAAGRTLVAPLVTRRWESYDVAFPGVQRTVPTAYNHVSGANLAGVVRDLFARRPSWQLRLGTKVTRMGATQVLLSSGEVVAADLVVDATGPQLERQQLPQRGYQKFVGLEVRLTAPHRLQRPVVMDAEVQQEDGLRFFYLLPLDDRRVLVEDTRFSDGPELNSARLSGQVRAYIEERGWQIAEVVRQEQGVLPLPWSRTEGVEVDASQPERHRSAPLRLGYGGGWFHPITGYSFGSAVRLAQHICRTAPQSRNAAFTRLQRRIRRQQSWLMLLNRALFRHYRPSDRWILMARFYRSPLKAIERFYAMTMTPWDFIRLVIGRPPAKMRLRPWTPHAALPLVTTPSAVTSAYATSHQEVSP